jgi:chromosome segregation ATPase
VDQYLSLENDVKSETKTINEVQKQLSFASARLAKIKARVETSSSAAGKIIQISNKEIDTKEFTTKRKLETVTSQFDFIVSENSDLRAEIDTILKENVRVMKRCKELEHISNKNKGEIDELVDQATSAYDQREEAVAKSNVLFERNEKEKKQYILEISELKRLIRHEEKLLDFMSTKNQDRVFLETDDERLSNIF